MDSIMVVIETFSGELLYEQNSIQTLIQLSQGVLQGADPLQEMLLQHRKSSALP